MFHELFDFVQNSFDFISSPLKLLINYEILAKRRCRIYARLFSNSGIRPRSRCTYRRSRCNTNWTCSCTISSEQQSVDAPDACTSGTNFYMIYAPTVRPLPLCCGSTGARWCLPSPEQRPLCSNQAKLQFRQKKNVMTCFLLFQSFSLLSPNT